MKRRKFIEETHASIYPVLIYIFTLAIVSFLILILDEVYIPFYQIGASTDTAINHDIDAPRAAFMSFLDILWPKGIMLAIFIIADFALIMEYQKEKYQRG
jgi:type II secretory pathway component PulF